MSFSTATSAPVCAAAGVCACPDHARLASKLRITAIAAMRRLFMVGFLCTVEWVGSRHCNKALGGSANNQADFMELIRVNPEGNSAIRQHLEGVLADYVTTR